jgi:hypothetical protein
VENLIKIAKEKYYAYFGTGRGVEWFYPNMKPRQSGIKLETKYIYEIEKAFSLLKDNGILILQTNEIHYLDILFIFKNSNIVYSLVEGKTNNLIVIK